MIRPPLWWREQQSAKRAAARREVAPTKGSRIWHVLNTPFAIWFFTVLVVGSASWIYADYWACMTQADQDARQVSAVRKEIFVRYMRLGMADAREVSSGVPQRG